MTDKPQRKDDVTESSLLLLDEHTAKATLDSLSISFGSEDGSIAPSGIYEPSIEAMETKSAPHHISRTPAHKYERLKRGKLRDHIGKRHDVITCIIFSCFSSNSASLLQAHTRERGSRI